MVSSDVPGVLCLASMAHKLVRSCFCCPPEWDYNDFNEDNFDAEPDVVEIRAFIGSNRSGLTRKGKCAGCIMPLKGCFCSSMCNICLVHLDYCKCRRGDADRQKAGMREEELGERTNLAEMGSIREATRIKEEGRSMPMDLEVIRVQQNMVGDLILKDNAYLVEMDEMDGEACEVEEGEDGDNIGIDYEGLQSGGIFVGGAGALVIGIFRFQISKIVESEKDKFDWSGPDKSEAKKLKGDLLLGVTRV